MDIFTESSWHHKTPPRLARTLQKATEEEQVRVFPRRDPYAFQPKEFWFVTPSSIIFILRGQVQRAWQLFVYSVNVLDCV